MNPQEIRRRRSDRLLVALAAIIGISLVMTPWTSEGACPQQWPHKEACIEFGTSCGDAFGEETCLTEVTIWDGWYGCEASGSETQCLVGLADNQTTCYVECACQWNWWDYEMDICEKIPGDCARHFRIPRVSKDCPAPGG